MTDFNERVAELERLLAEHYRVENKRLREVLDRITVSANAIDEILSKPQ